MFLIWSKVRTNPGATSLPRRSAAALVICTSGPRRIEPPVELGEVEAKIFRETVAAVALDHFQAEDSALLASYARAVALERRAAEELAVAATVGSVPSPWLAVHSAMARTVMQLSVRLRIGPRSRAPSNNRRSTKSGPAPNYYATMKLEGAGDAKGRS
jgi:phage terminase small subunit